MTIPKKGGYSGGRPASEMSPPANLPSVTIMGANRPRRGWPSEKLQERVAHHESLHAAGDRRLSRDGEVIVTLSQQLQLALSREARAKEQLDEAVNGDEARAHRVDVAELSALALFHAQHQGVSESDRKKILDLVVRISDRIVGRREPPRVGGGGAS